MLPGMNARQMAKIISQMGIKNSEVPAVRVVIEKEDGSKFVVSEPIVVMVEVQGQKSFQVSGEVREEGGSGGALAGKEVSDVELVMQQAGVSREQAEAALKETNGDIAGAIIALQKKE
ncbi:MAG: nascent polypeptide-associated complex protein [Candidatus Micrarchaeia archaeon]